MNATASAATVRPAFVPGHFPDMPDSVYHEVEAMSAHGAKKMIRSPRHFRLMRDKPTESTKVQLFGRAVHVGVLESEHFAKRVLCAPEVNARTKDGKAERDAFIASHPGATILDAEAYKRAQDCIAAVLEHPMARELLNGARTEQSLFWHDGEYGCPCKTRIDVIGNDVVIADLKTTDDASPDAFARQAAKNLYHMQAAFNNAGHEAVLDSSMSLFAFIAVESEPPHAVACYMLPPHAVLAGQHLMNIALERYAVALKAGEWAGYPEELYALPFPRYALTFNR